MGLVGAGGTQPSLGSARFCLCFAALFSFPGIRAHVAQDRDLGLCDGVITLLNCLFHLQSPGGIMIFLRNTRLMYPFGKGGRRGRTGGSRQLDFVGGNVRSAWRLCDPATTLVSLPRPSRAPGAVLRAVRHVTQSASPSAALASPLGAGPRCEAAPSQL